MKRKTSWGWVKRGIWQSEASGKRRFDLPKQSEAELAALRDGFIAAHGAEAIRVPEGEREAESLRWPLGRPKPWQDGSRVGSNRDA